MRSRPRAAVEIPGSPALVRAGMWVAALSVASKLLGIVREAFLAWAFGTSAVADALRVAQTGTFLVIHLLAGSALDSAFLPTFKHHLAAGRPRVAWRTAALAGRSLAVAGGLVFAGLVTGAHGWARLLAPGFDRERLDLTALLVVAMAAAVPLGLLANLAGTVSAGLYRFRVPAVRAAVQNLALLGGIAAALALGSVVWLGASLPLAQAAMLALLVVSLRRLGRPRAAGSPARDRALWRHFGLALVPGLALVCLEQGQLVIEKVVASHLRPGSVAALEYARFLVETPVVTLGVGITQPLLPRLSDLSATGDEAGFRRSMQTLLLACVWGLLPVSAWLLVFAEDVIRLVYARGAFDEASVVATAAALGGFAAGMWAWFGGMVLRQAFYARRRLAALLPLTAMSLAGFAGLALLWAPRHGVGGVALAFGVAQILFFAGGLAASGRALLGSVLPTLGFLLVGSAGVWGLGRWAAVGVLAGAHPALRLAGGALAIGLAWAGWTWLRPGTRAIARDAWERARALGGRVREGA